MPLAHKDIPGRESDNGLWQMPYPVSPEHNARLSIGSDEDSVPLLSPEVGGKPFPFVRGLGVRKRHWICSFSTGTENGEDGAMNRTKSNRPARAGRHILVVEDNPDGRETLRVLLELLGHRVDVAADGSEGVAKALALRPEIAVVDIGLPVLDGYQVARQLRAALGRDIFLIAHTGYGQPEDRQRALAAGFDLHLVKPVEVEELSACLSQATVDPCFRRPPGFAAEQRAACLDPPPHCKNGNRVEENFRRLDRVR